MGHLTLSFCVMGLRLDSDSCGFIPDGSSSSLFTTSGVSSEDVNPTDGRYGSVITGASWGIVIVIFPC